MALSVSSVSDSTENVFPTVERRTANYMPSIWGDLFIEYTSGQEEDTSSKERIEELKDQVKVMLRQANEAMQKMSLIDALQRLGVAYHFEEEIVEALDWLYEETDVVVDDDLFAIALRFRLLRQHGYNLSPDVFQKFKDEDGNFKKILSNDVKGMLELYEASHLIVSLEEKILQEAIAFTREQLNSALINLDSSLAKQVKRALELPLHKSMQRIEARYFISIYERDQTRNDVLLELAKLDFNMLQSLHRREVQQVSRWYKDLGLAKKLPFARDRVVENYMWMLGAFFEPQFSDCRMQLNKLACVIMVADDLYDIYGTLDELKLLTEAIERWDLEAMVHLPEYMKVFYAFLYNTTKEFEQENMREGGSNNIHYFKKSFIDLCKAYFVEAKWFNARHVPTLEEYLSIATTTAAYPVLITLAAVSMGRTITRDTLDLVANVCPAIRFSSVIARLLDDVETTQAEQERGDVASSVQCFMNEHGVTEHEARLQIRRLVEVEWIKLNKEILKPTTLPKPLLMCIVGLACTAEVFYQHGDGYGVSAHQTKDHITSLLIQPILI